MPAAGSGTCNLTWMDCASGAIVTQTGVVVPAGDNTWPKPSGFGNEVALSIRKTGGATSVESGLAPSSWGRIKSTFRR